MWCRVCGLWRQGHLCWLILTRKVGWAWVLMFCVAVGPSITLGAQPQPPLCLPQGPHQAPWEQKPWPSGLNPAPASCRLNSTEYGELCEKLRAPIRSAAHVVIRQSLSDLFLDTFASLVDANPAYSVPSSQVGGWVGAGGFP